ncbi:aspartoacylase [Acaryochloris marina NIES-2412]|uniref:aspartoacylase n=1 Tax=Acaryochloris marina TaxID=155978 RepID=UPI0040587168
MRIKRVLLVGGTHGNELIGINLVKKYEQYPELFTRSSFETLTLLGNPSAIDNCVRYIDKDLNRCFNFQALDNEITSSFYETQRAREISDQFGQSGRTPVDLIIDQHSTTSNVGLMLMVDSLDPFILNLSAYLTSIIPTLKIYHSAISGRNKDSLRSIAKYGISIEVGPLSHGTLHADLLHKTETFVQAALDYVEKYNHNTISSSTTFLTLYEYVDSIDYPRNKWGEIHAMIHSQIQFKDFEVLNPGDPIFLTFDGKTVVYQGVSDAYPVFINEAAYYEKGIAVCLARKQKLEIGKNNK